MQTLEYLSISRAVRKAEHGPSRLVKKIETSPHKDADPRLGPRPRRQLPRGLLHTPHTPHAQTGCPIGALVALSFSYHVTLALARLTK
jgi:hypothetical protein